MAIFFFLTVPLTKTTVREDCFKAMMKDSGGNKLTKERRNRGRWAEDE